jgi:TonB family protein
LGGTFEQQKTMTAKQQPRGNSAVSPLDQGKIVSLHGAGVEARVVVESSALSDAADLSNVVPFARVRRAELERETPPLLIDDAARPAPLFPRRKARARLLAFAAFSLAVHVALYLALMQEPKPLASVGIEAINVEIVLGANTPAGLATDQGENHVQAPAQEQQTEQQQADEKTAVEVPQQPDATASVSPEQPKEPEQPVAERAAPKPKQTVERPPERKRVATRANDKAKADRSSSPSTPSSAASGIGRGRSDADTNYRGLVAAHLARHKQYPAEARARGEQGSATLTFTLDGGGRVTSARLVRGSGSASIDQEVQAMARRASPFPAPPNGRPASFTVPVSFGIR